MDDVSPAAPVARSPVAQPAPVEVAWGWEVSRRTSTAPLQLVDLSLLAKILVRADGSGAAAARLGVPHGRAQRREDGVLVVGSGPGEWLLVGPPERGERLRMSTAEALDTGPEELVSVVDLTHGRALLRLTGERGPDLLAKLCAVNLADRATPDGAAFRSSVAGLVTDVVRHDLDGLRSYLLHCERSSGQYLAEALLDAGAEFDIELVGMTDRDAKEI